MRIHPRVQAVWFIIALMFLFSGILHFAANVRAEAPQPAAPVGVYMPIIKTQSEFSQVVLKGGDHGLVASAIVDGHLVVAYQVRPQGIIHVTEDIGTSLQELPLATAALANLRFDAPPTGPPTTDPGFVFPSSPKQGSITMQQVGDALYLWATARVDGDVTGPFTIQRVIIPIDDLWPSSARGTGGQP